MNLIFRYVMGGDRGRWVVSGAHHPLVAVVTQGDWTMYVIGACLGDFTSVLDKLDGAAPDLVAERFAQLRLRSHGHYALVAVGDGAGHAVINSDAYGICKIYLAKCNGVTVFGTCMAQVAAIAGVRAWLEPAVAYFLLHGYTPSRHTFYLGLEKLPPGTSAVIEGAHRADRPWSFDGPDWLEEDAYYARVVNAWDASMVAVEQSGHTAVAALSGGIDSTLLLTSLVEREGMNGRVIARTGAIHLAPDACAPINAPDVDAARAIAFDLRVPHEVRRVELFDVRLVDRLANIVAVLGADAHFGALMFTQICGGDRNELMLAAQNADSVFSYTVVGTPSLGTSIRKPIDGVGNLLLRYLYFGGSKQIQCSRDFLWRAVLGSLYRAKRQRSIGDVTTRDCQLGMLLKTRWPLNNNDERTLYAGPNGALARWFLEGYLGPVEDLAAPEVHAAALLEFFRHTFMQGSDNRGTAWSCLAQGNAAFLPFASDALLAASLRRKPSPLTWFKGKWPVYRMAQAQPGMPPRAFSKRPDLPANIEFEIYKAMLSNPGVRERTLFHLQHQADQFERLEPILGKEESAALRERWLLGAWIDSKVHLDFRVLWLLESNSLTEKMASPASCVPARDSGEDRA